MTGRRVAFPDVVANSRNLMPNKLGNAATFEDAFDPAVIILYIGSGTDSANSAQAMVVGVQRGQIIGMVVRRLILRRWVATVCKWAGSSRIWAVGEILLCITCGMHRDTGGQRLCKIGCTYALVGFMVL